MTAAESVPLELRAAALSVQLGDIPNWRLVRAMIRNGLLSRRLGTWVLTTTGLGAAALARAELGESGALRDQSVKERGPIYRWVGISSTAHLDRDGEFVTRKALEGDAARADGDGDYGPLVWWHEYEPLITDLRTEKDLLYEALVLGHCDFNMLDGDNGEYLIESGLFSDERVGKAAFENQDRLSMSIKFDYREGDLDGDSYLALRRRERSLLPRGAEANEFTRFWVVEL